VEKILDWHMVDEESKEHVIQCKYFVSKNKNKNVKL
jgi:hypothetical protein